ncbi:MAG: hypothetical protein ACRYG8_49545 [Janthinobacterium lividum]
MSAPTSPANAAQAVRLLLKSLQSNDREAIVLHLVELGLWVTVRSDPLPPPDVSIVSSAALTIALNELRSTIQLHRKLSASIPDRDTISVAAIIERNAEMMESVVRALAILTPSTGFLMVEG